MRRTQLPTLVASLLLLSRVSLGFKPAPQLDGGAESDSRRLLLLLRDREDRAAPWPLQPPLPAPGPEVAALLVRSVRRVAPERELRRRLAELSDRLTRSEPQLSIDLTFELLRRMIEIRRRQSLEAQAEENRLLLESVGK